MLYGPMAAGIAASALISNAAQRLEKWMMEGRSKVYCYKPIDISDYVLFCFRPILTSKFPTTQLTANTASSPPKMTSGLRNRAANG